MLTSRRHGRVAAAVAAALIAAAALYAALRAVAPLVRTAGAGCQIAARGSIPLTPGQAGIAATIAGVAQHRGLGGRAVTVAYAAALQESKLQNLRYGDRDSVGIFQQRPSQGWGPASRIEQPVYATTRFFAALAAIPGYQRLPVYRAAQDVQHSADGWAYAQYAAPGAALARAFSGRAPHAVWCWYGAGTGGRPRLAAMTRELRRTFGPLRITSGGDPVLTVAASRRRDDWAEAAWLVTHAQAYGIRGIRCAGLQWSAARGEQGWQRSRGPARAKPPPGTVVLG